MFQTPEQKNTIRTTWIAALIFGILYAVIYFWRTKPEYDSLYDAFISAPRLKLQALVPYVFYVLIWAAWSWDWLVKKDYVKAIIMLLAMAAVYGLLNYVLPEKNERDGENEKLWLQYIKNTFLYSPLIWAGVLRGVIESQPRQIIAGLITGFLSVVFIEFFIAGRIGISVFALPYYLVMHLIFGGDASNWFNDLLYGQNGYTINMVLMNAAAVFFIQWLYQFFSNLLDPDKREEAANIFGNAFPETSGRYFAALFPILYVLTISAATCCLFYVAMLFKSPFLGNLSDWFNYSINLRSLMTKGSVITFLFIPLSAYLTTRLFLALRTLVLSRCITLNQKFGLNYLFAFVPFVNIIPWIVLSVTKKPEDESARLRYASMMNSGNEQRSMITVNLLIGLAILGSISALAQNSTALGMGIGFLGVLITLLSLGMYIGFVYRPEMIWGVISVKLFAVLLVYFMLPEYARSSVLPLIFLALYSIMMLFWQKKIFFPDIDIPVPVTFDAEKDIQQTESGAQA